LIWWLDADREVVADGYSRPLMLLLPHGPYPADPSGGAFLAALHTQIHKVSEFCMDKAEELEVRRV